MAARKRNSDDVQATQDQFGGESEPAQEDLYQTEISRYADVLDRNPEEAFERYGFTLFHSLPPVKQIELSQKVGLMHFTALDHYNLGVLAIEEGDLNKGIEHFQKSLELDGRQAESAFNLAVAYERLDRKSDAINTWSRFLELTQSDEDRQQVEAHLAELRG